MCEAFLGLMKYDFHWNVYSSAYSRIFSYSSDIEEIILKIAEASSAHHIVLSSTSGRGGRVSMSAVRKTVFVIFFFALRLVQSNETRMVQTSPGSSIMAFLSTVLLWGVKPCKSIGF